MLHHYIIAIAVSLSLPLTAFAQKSGPATPYRTLTYADIADLALAGKVAAQVRIRRATRIKGAQAASVESGRKRFLVEADVLTLIRGSEAVAPRITYLIDLAPDSLGRIPKLERGEAIIFANRVPNYPGEVRLVSPDAQLAATPENLTRIRLILTEATGDRAPPAVTGISSVFHNPGSLPGEGETQIFLDTQDARPVSLSILHSPGLVPRWTVSLGELVEQASPPPPRNTLLWYRLACFLPATLPGANIESLAAADAIVAQGDYGFVMRSLGQCPRALAHRPG